MGAIGEVRCRGCSSSVDDDGPVRRPCPKCGSLSRSFVEHAEVTIRARTSLSWKHGRAGRKKPLAEGISGAGRSTATGRWVEKSRLIDRGNSWYQEIIVDEGTGEVVRDCREPLSDHQGQGSAKLGNGSRKDSVTASGYISDRDCQGGRRG